MKNIKFALLALFFSTIFIAGCSDDKITTPSDDNDKELITTFRLTITDTTSGTVTTRVFEYKDSDGLGGNPPSAFDTIILDSHRTYHTAILLLNESVSPVDTISNEVIAEGDDHQFFFVANPPELGTFSYLEPNDSQGRPIGINTRWQINAIPSGSITITLKHMPGIKPDGATINNPPSIGESDIELPFNVVIQ